MPTARTHHTVGRSPMCSAAVRNWTPIAVLLLSLCGCASSQKQATAEQVRALAGESASGGAGSVTVREAWIPPPPGGAYPRGSGVMVGLTLMNNGSSWDSLTSVSTPDAPRVSLSQFNIAQDFISLTTDPNRIDAMAQLMGITDTISPGERVPMTFHFRSAGSVTLQVPVRTPPGPPQGGGT